MPSTWETNATLVPAPLAPPAPLGPPGPEPPPTELHADSTAISSAIRTTRGFEIFTTYLPEGSRARPPRTGLGGDPGPVERALSAETMKLYPQPSIHVGTNRVNVSAHPGRTCAGAVGGGDEQAAGLPDRGGGAPGANPAGRLPTRSAAS